MTVCIIKSRNTSAYRHSFSSVPFPPRKSLYRRKLTSLSRKIKKLERQLDCEIPETRSREAKLSLKQLQQRVDRLEKKLRSKNQQDSLALCTKSCLKFLLSEAKHWHNIGILLAVPESTLEQIETDYPGDCQQCVREMIKSWLKQVDPPPSWKDLAQAVSTVNPNLAKKITKSAISSSSC